jgi:iron complex outermembrane receptor protein
MKNQQFTMKRLGRTTMAVAVGMCFVSIVQAQVEEAQRVEVTGSRIRQVDRETAQPIQIMSQEQIQKTGLVTVGDILNKMSSAGTPAFSKGSVLTSNNEQGGQYIDMRNLGSERLLVLVDGKRWTQTVGGYTDMSTIPSSMISRIEILKDGASSIYGSDAIAGVVNVILKKRMDGGEISAYVGQNQKGDGKTEDYSFSYGAGNEKASIMFGISHSKQEAVWARDREVTAYSYGPGHYDAGFGAGPWGRIRQIDGSGGASATGFDQFLNHSGSYNGAGVGSSSRNPANYHEFTGANEDSFNSSQQMMFQAPTQLSSIFTKGTIELPADMRITSTAMYATRSSNRSIAGYPLNSLSQPDYPVYIDKDSYYNPYGNQVAGAGAGSDLFFNRRTIEVPRMTDNQNNTFHIDAALEGDLLIRDMPWNWSVGVNHSSSSGTTRSTGNLNLLALKSALGPSFMNANQVVQCGTAANPIALASCAPFDILGGPSASNANALNGVMSTGQATYGSTISSLNADIAGEVYQLPAGALGFAAGVEKRDVRGYDRPGQFEQSGYSTDLAGNSTEGSYSVKEVYAEVNIPLLKAKPFAELLTVNLASRHSDYNNFGKTTNSKASFMWKPVKDLLTRGTIAEGFRAPALGDTFGGGSQSFDTYLDPCDTVNGEAARNPAVQARCAAAGVPGGFRQLNQAGNPVASGGGQSNVPFLAGAGNNSLSPETAKTKTLGLVYNPSFLPGLSTSLDYFDITVKNRITGITANYTAEQCYINNVQSFCGNIQRDPITGAISNLARGNANLGELATRGIDVGLSYKFPMSKYGQFNVRTDTTYVDSFKEKSTALSEWVDYAGEFGYNRVKSNISVDWSQGNWSATLGTRYYSGTKTQCWESDVECSNPGGQASWGTDYDRKGALVYNDLSIAYDTPWKGKILVGANNFLNKKPRIVYDATINGQSSSSSVDPEMPLERFIYVRYNQSF